MQWIIKHNPSGKYICSKKISVINCEFSRKFNSVRQARIFLRNSNFDKKECSVEQYNSEEHFKYTSHDEIAKYIHYNFLNSNKN